MKSNFRKLLMLSIMFFSAMLFAQTENTLDFTDPASVITWLMPVITFGSVWLIKKIAPFIKGVITLIAVPLVAWGIAALADWLILPEISYLEAIIAGTASVFLHQLQKEITS